jgi:hypothetical protein
LGGVGAGLGVAARWTGVGLLPDVFFFAAAEAEKGSAARRAAIRSGSGLWANLAIDHYPGYRVSVLHDFFVD